MADASGLFNLMRNLGGAIGIALIDTILYGRSRIYAEDFRVRLLAGDVTRGDRRSGSIRSCCSTGRRDRRTLRPSPIVRPMVEKASLALCVNEAWAMLAGVAMRRPAAGAVRARTHCAAGMPR